MAKRRTAAQMFPVSATRKVLFLIVIVLFVFTSVYFYIFNMRESFKSTSVLWKILQSSEEINKRELLVKLNSLHQVISKNSFSVASILLRVENIIKSVDIDYLPSSKKVSMPYELDVCPEMYMGPRFGYMYFVTGWVTRNCTNVKPIEKVISVVLNPLTENENKCPNDLIEGIRNTYKKMNIIIPYQNFVNCKNKSADFLQNILVDKKWKAGRKWNAMMKNVKTPYVLIARDLDYFIGWLTRLERQIRVISFIPRVQIAGGAVRNRTGHWQVGCYQSDMRNYVLKYEDGYYVSRNECMYCDYIMGPFVAKTEIFKKIAFNEDLPKAVVFEDFFLRVKQSSHLVMNCPDVMYLASDATIIEKENNRLSWQSLAKKWELNRIVLPNGKVFGYSCEESGINCKNIKRKTNYYLLPPCCLEQYAKAVSIFHKFCLNNNLVYEVEAGSTLGVVKMSDYIPWDLDGDFIFYTQNLSVFISSMDYFKKFGILLTGFQYRNKVKTRSSFRYRTPDLYIEFWGEVQLSKDLYNPEIFMNTPTKAKLHGNWINVCLSPGLYARNRYGVEMLRHSQSWSQISLKSSWCNYTSGKFKPCKNSNHHACLDHFLTDGNLQFRIPSPNCILFMIHIY